MVNRRFHKSFNRTIIKTGVVSSPEFLRSPDTIAVRKMAREGKTFNQIREFLGHTEKKRDYTWKWLHNRHIYNVKVDKIPRKPETEEVKAQKAEKMRIWYAEHGDQFRFPKTNKVKPMRITTPSWYAEARKERAAGVSVKDLAKKYKVTDSRIYQVTAPEWEKYVGTNHRKETSNMSDRTFEKTRANEQNPQDNRAAVKIVCTDCHKEAKFVRHGSISPIHAAQYFRNHGWAVGAGPRADKCPECLAKIGKKEPKKETTVTVAPSTLQHPTAPLTTTAEYIKDMKPLTAEAGKEAVKAEARGAEPMSKKDKQVVFIKLTDAYDLDKECYKADWTDEKVAADLGCPIEWVHSVREAEFGPAVDKSVIERQQLEARFTAIYTSVEHQAGIVKQLAEKLETLWDAYDKRMEQFEKDYAELHRTYQALTKAKQPA